MSNNPNLSASIVARKNLNLNKGDKKALPVLSEITGYFYDLSSDCWVYLDVAKNKIIKASLTQVYAQVWTHYQEHIK